MAQAPKIRFMHHLYSSGGSYETLNFKALKLPKTVTLVFHTNTMEKCTHKLH